MKFGIQILILFVVISGLTNCKKESNDILYDKNYIKEIKAARQDMGLYLTRNQIPGASVAISKNGKIIYSEGIGLASRDLDVQATRETKFRIGELSEIFTSFIYLRMVEDGLLHPDSSIQHYIPDFPEKEFKITLHHLVNQISGLREPRKNEKDSQEQNITLQKGIASFKNDPLQSYPGLDQIPNMFEYNLLGVIMEKVTNKKFNQILKEYVTDTLKLSNTIIADPFNVIDGRTDFFDKNIMTNTINATFRDFRYSAPSQGLLSNAEDLVIFGDAILHSDIILKETKETMFKRIVLFDDTKGDMANAWFLMVDDLGYDMYGRTGSIVGGSSIILLYPEYGLVIASITNLSTGNEYAPLFKMVEHFIERDTIE